MAPQPVQIRFAVAPFLPEHQPALGVSTLLSILRDNSIPADIVYLNLEYRSRIGEYLYYYLSRALPSEYLLGEMIFTPALWGSAACPWQDYERQLRQYFPAFTRHLPSQRDKADVLLEWEREWESLVLRIRELHKESSDIIRQWARELLQDQPRIIGFTSTFQQHIASLAVAKELRRLVPRKELLIIFGGANCEAGMGQATADHFPFIDHVVSGEGEQVILQLARGVPKSPRFIISSKVQEINTLPVPTFDHYFKAIKGTDLDREKKANLVAESSRGCWWGGRCSFCGLNGTSLTYRSKAPLSFARELRTLASRYGPTFFLMADNILDMKYFGTLFPELAARGDKLTLFYETRSNLRKEQLEIIRAGGVVRIQPGIESLSTAVLQLMGKGTTRLQNLQMLKWCEEFCIQVKWNFLYGFPGEPPEVYREMAELIPLVFHLPPPASAARVRLDRFGSYWRSPGLYGIRNMRRYWAYDFCYSGLEPSERERIAYFFQFDYGDRRDSLGYAAPVIDAVDRWHQAYRQEVTLEVKSNRGNDYLVDTRDGGREMVYPLSPSARRLLMVLDVAHTPGIAFDSLDNLIPGSEKISSGEFHSLVEQFLERQWLIEENGKLLSLVLDRTQRQRVIQRRAALQLEELGLPVTDKEEV